MGNFFEDIGEGVLDIFGGSKKKTQTTQTQYWTPEQQDTSNLLASYFKSRVGGPSPSYGQTRVAGMSQPEQGSQQLLTQYMNQGAPQQWNWANTNLGNIMANRNYGQIVNPSQTRNLYNWATSQTKGPLAQTQSGPIVDPSQTRNLYNWAQSQAQGPLEGSQSKDIISDKATDQLYQRIKDQTLRELPDIQNTLANNANLRGMYFSGGHNQIQGDLLKDTSSRLLDTLANLKYGDEQARRGLEQTREGRRYDTLRDILGAGYGQQYGDIRTSQDVARDREGRQYMTMDDIIRSSMAQQYGDIQTGQDVGREREGRQFASIPYAMQMGETQSQFPLEQAKAGMELGQLPRQLQQQNLDARYQEWMQHLPENNPAIAQALAYLARQGMSSEYGESTGRQGILGGMSISI